MNYKSLFLEGLSVINTSRADIEDTDIQCAVSTPNALFSAAKRHPTVPLARISTFDTSRPFDPRHPSTHTFKLIEMSLKPAGRVSAPPESQIVVGITFVMLKSPPDPVAGHGDAVEIFPGLLRGEPVPTLRAGAGLGVAFRGTDEKPFRLWPGLFRGWNITGFGEGSDMLGFDSSLMVYNEKTERWDVEDFGLCVDDIVFEVSEVGKTGTQEVHTDKPVEELKALDGPLIFKADGQLAVEGEQEFEAMSQLMQGL